MPVKREYRDRDATQVAVLDALVNRGEEGMTVLELRAAVAAEIDELEEALSTLKADGLIHVEHPEGSTVITPADRVVPSEDDGAGNEQSLGEWLRERMPL